MKTLKLKSAMTIYWVLVAILIVVIAVLSHVGPAGAAEARSATIDPSRGFEYAAPDLPSSARTRQYDDKVIFRYLDDGFETVAVAGDFSDWQPVEMELDPRSNAWSVTVGMEPGRYSYQYLVTEDDETWEAIDPSNAHARKEAEHGWVSRIRVPEDFEDVELTGAEDTALAAESEAESEAETEEPNARFEIRWDGFDDDEDDLDDLDDEELWRQHHRRFVNRELQRTYRLLGDNISFQRVDGLSLFFAPEGVSREDFGPAVKGLFSYGFRSEEWTLGGKIIQPLTPNRRVLAVAQGHAGTDFRNITGIHGYENSLAAVFFREDFRDYFKREGLTLSLVAFPTTTMRLEAGYDASDYSSLETKETWSFADGDYAENPAVDEGTMRTWFANATVGTRNNCLRLAWESTLDRDEEDFDFSKLSTTYRGRLEMSDARYFDFRVLFATALSGELPVQRRDPVGGLGTVRGYYYQSLLERDPDRDIRLGPIGGQRMLVGNFEYAIAFDTNIITGSHDWDDDWDEFDGFGDFDIDSALFLFCDTGMAWEDREADLDLNDLKTSVGIGFRIDDSGPRFDLIKTLDDGGHDTMVQIRLERMF